MSKTGFLVRFFLIYLFAMGSLGVTTGILIEKGILEINQSSVSSFNTPILMLIAGSCFFLFAKRNSRLLANKELWLLSLIATIGNLLATIILVIPTVIMDEMPLFVLMISFVFMLTIQFFLTRLSGSIAMKIYRQKYPHDAQNNLPT